MKVKSTGLQEYGNVKVGMRRMEQTGTKMRIVQCKSIELGENGKYYASWQYILKNTGKIASKSGIWLTEIKNY